MVLGEKQKRHCTVYRDLLYADDCSSLAHSLVNVQLLFDRFFRLSNSILTYI